MGYASNIIADGDGRQPRYHPSSSTEVARRVRRTAFDRSSATEPVLELSRDASTSRGRAEAGASARPGEHDDAFTEKDVAEFARALYRPEKDGCRLAALAVGAVGSPQDLARRLLSPAARRIGEDWNSDTADFIQVTIAVSKLSMLFREACSADPPKAPQDRRRRILLTAAPGGQHGFGLAVAEDAFRREGWLVDSEDGDALMNLAACTPYHVIGISIAAERDLAGLDAFVEALRRRSRNRAVTVMAGGSFAACNSGALLAAGFDLVSPDCAQALRLAAEIADGRAAVPIRRKG